MPVYIPSSVFLNCFRILAALLCVLLFVSCTAKPVSEPDAIAGIPMRPDLPHVVQYVIALDAGHGGMDSGACALIREVTVCEQTVDHLFSLLERDCRFRPVRTRPNGEDRSIRERADTASAAGADILLSIHANCDDHSSQSHGFECFPTPPGRTYSEESMRFAQQLALYMEQAGHRLRGGNGIRFAYYDHRHKYIVDSTDNRVRTQKSFGMVEMPGCPSVLAEQCFISNRNDVDNWTGDAGCAHAAGIYYQAICGYFGVEPDSSGSA